MSLDNFFTMPKKRDARKKNKSAASEALANPDDEPELANDEEPESCSEPGK